MKVEAIRDLFIDYFVRNGHQKVASSSLVPMGDDTLLFTNAGMVQFKDAFLGANRGYTRATSVQRCVRAGGKHNDLDNVGYTARHHTFFEMLGNFSFGDYFKKEAITFAWRFLTEELKIDRNRLWVTVYREDREAENIWLNEMGVSPERFSRCGENSNFWAMGDTGPCGPCTEIFYDHGPEIWGGPPGSPEEDGDRYVEIWNLVFMQYNRTEKGELQPLPKPSVDTGMGLERIAAVMQEVHNNYDIDLFVDLIEAAAKLLQVKDKTEKSLRVIADHIRSCAFLVCDGVNPSNEGRGYVLRRIIRRAIRHGHRLGASSSFFHQLVAPLVKGMGRAYPELASKQAHIEKVLEKEEQQFARTLDNGLQLLEQAMKGMNKGDSLSGEVVFKLYDTYGFPVDLTADMARERDLGIDEKGFNDAMEQQRKRAREAGQFSAAPSMVCEGETQFVGYESLVSNAHLTHLYRDSEPVESLAMGEEGVVVLDTSPFYAESGGQIGDKGLLKTANGVFEVIDTVNLAKAYAHRGVVKQGTLSVNDKVTALVDQTHRKRVMANHSATHLLHAALRHHLGEGVQQKGSLVTAERLRFDFAYSEPLKASDLLEIERLVNEKIWDNTPVLTECMSVDQAMKKGAMALFGEKYGATVRVLTMADAFSVELCGGTHVKQTGDIGLFKIVSEAGIAAGVRRVEALTQWGAYQWMQALNEDIEASARLLKTDKSGVSKRITQVLERQRELEKHGERLANLLAQHSKVALKEQAVDVGGVKVLLAAVPHVNAEGLRLMIDELGQSWGKFIILLSAVDQDRLALVAGVGAEEINCVSAQDLIRFIAPLVGAKGGGRKDIAQAGGGDPAKVSAAFVSALEWIREKLKSD